RQRESGGAPRQAQPHRLLQAAGASPADAGGIQAALSGTRRSALVEIEPVPVARIGQVAARAEHGKGVPAKLAQAADLLPRHRPAARDVIPAENEVAVRPEPRMTLLEAALALLTRVQPVAVDAVAEDHIEIALREVLAELLHGRHHVLAGAELAGARGRIDRKSTRLNS